MKLDDVPRLPKLPFILGDIALLLLAWLIAARHPHPFSPLPLLLIAGCVALGCVAFAIPVVVNYVRDQEEMAGALRRELSEQFKRLMAAAEHLQHSTAQLKTIEEIATKNLQAAEKLPYRLQEKIAEFNQQLADTESEEREALEQELVMLRSSESERLAAAAGKIAQAAAEWTKMETGARQQLAAAAQLEPKLAAVLAAIDGRIAALDAAIKAANQVLTAPASVAALAEPPPAILPRAAPPSAPAPLSPEPRVVEPSPGVEAAAAVASADSPTAAPKPSRKPRPPKKPTVEESATAAPAGPEPASAETSRGVGRTAEPPPLQPETTARVAAELIAEPVADEPSAPEDYSQVPPEDGRPAPTPSGDGHTRLTVVSYIGIGNKLYLRGEGPGLSWDKGVPLQFVSIGRWRWETGEATVPVTCKVYKNDKLEAPLGVLNLAPGTEQEVTASF